MATAAPTSGTGRPLNELLYSKQQYDTGGGNKDWAANNAKQYYAQLAPDVAAQVKGMNTDQLKTYIQQQAPATPPTAATPPTPQWTNPGNPVAAPTQSAQQVAPQQSQKAAMPTYQPPAPTYAPAPQATPLYEDPYKRSQDSIAALAKARIDAILAAGKTAQQGALTGAKNANDYTNVIKGDDRTLRNATFKETNNPFSGNTGYLAANMTRNDSIQDTAQSNDYNANVAQINAKLADLQAASPGQEQQIIDDLQQMERKYGIDVAQLQTQQQNQNFNQSMATNQFNRGTFESDRNFGQQQQAQDFNQMNTNRNFDYGMGQDQIQNNRADTQLGMQQNQQRFAQNMQIDEQAYSHARDSIMDERYKAEFDNNVKQIGFENALKKAAADHQISSDNAQLAISRQNANTSAANASNSSANQIADNQLNRDKLNWDMNASNPSNIPKSVTTKVDPKTSTNNAQTIKSNLSIKKDATKEQKIAYVQSLSDQLTDADYKDLINSIY